MRITTGGYVFELFSIQPGPSWLFNAERILPTAPTPREELEEKMKNVVGPVSGQRNYDAGKERDFSTRVFGTSICALEHSNSLRKEKS